MMPMRELVLRFSYFVLQRLLCAVNQTPSNGLFTNSLETTTSRCPDESLSARSMPIMKCIDLDVTKSGVEHQEGIFPLIPLSPEMTAFRVGSDLTSASSEI